MDTKKLRQKILDLAIRGKLVPQDPNDEPASVLLERIRAEKERLIKEGKIKRSKKTTSDTPHYENEVPFEIPEGWCWCRLDDLAFYKKGPFGSSLTKSMFVPDSSDAYKVYEQKNAINKDATLGHYYIDKSKFEELKGFAVQPEDIIVSCAGTIGETYVLPHDIREGIINQALMTIRLFDKSISDFYLLYFDFILKSEAAKESKGTAIKNIPPFDILKNFIIPLPPQTEQKRIIEKVSYWLSLVDAIDGEGSEMSNLISKAKSKILDLAIHGKLVPQDPNDEPAIELLKCINPKFTPCDNAHDTNQLPKSWCWATLGNIFQHNTGKALNKSDSLEGTLKPYLTTSNVYWDSFDFTEVKQMYFKDSEIDKYTVQKGDLLVCEGGDIGRAAIWNYDHDICIQNHIHRLRAKGMIDHRLYLYVLMLYKWTDKIHGKGIGLQGLSSGLVDKLIIPVSPYNEQKRIVAKIEELFAVLDEIKESLEA